jgi:hypothetical protein
MGGDRASVYPRCPRDAVLVPDHCMRARSAPTSRRAGLTSITECFRTRRLSEDLAACGSLLVALAPMREWRCTSLVAARRQSRWRCMRCCQGFHSEVSSAISRVLRVKLPGEPPQCASRCCAGASGEAPYWPSPPHEVEPGTRTITSCLRRVVVRPVAVRFPLGSGGQRPWAPRQQRRCCTSLRYRRARDATASSTRALEAAARRRSDSALHVPVETSIRPAR